MMSRAYSWWCHGCLSVAIIYLEKLWVTIPWHLQIGLGPCNPQATPEGHAHNSMTYTSSFTQLHPPNRLQEHQKKGWSLGDLHIHGLLPVTTSLKGSPPPHSCLYHKNSPSATRNWLCPLCEACTHLSPSLHQRESVVYTRLLVSHNQPPSPHSCD